MKRQFTRRDFLRAAAASSAAGMLGLAFKPQRALAAGLGFRVLVKIELLGGCDSHGLWLPTDSARFYALKARRATNTMFVQTPAELMDIGYSQGIGLHPNLAPLMAHIPHTRFFMNTSNAHLTGQSGSHEEAQNRMTMGTSQFNGKFEGWTARLYDNDPNCQLLAFLGTRGANVNCDRGIARCQNSPPITVDTFENFKFDGASFPWNMGGQNNSNYVRQIIERLANARPVSQQPSQVEKEFDSALRGTFPAIEVVAHTASFHSPLYAQYNVNDKFALQLRNVAMKVKQLTVEPSSDRFVFSLGVGGFDVHENWGSATPWLMSSLGNALGTFMSDMQAMGTFENVVVMTSTEFGRTLYSNAVGTDHGDSSTTMVMGGAVKGGSSAVYGDVLTAAQFGTLYASPSYIDNRGIIASILNQFMGVDYTLAFPGPIAQEFTVGNYDLFDGGIDI